jgi:hypothetical protein
MKGILDVKNNPSTGKVTARSVFPYSLWNEQKRV